jgi:hypothetical protein
LAVNTVVSSAVNTAQKTTKKVISNTIAEINAIKSTTVTLSKNVQSQVFKIASNIKESIKNVKKEDLLNGLQTALDIAGLIPVAGEIFDGANALIYLARGDYVNAALSGAACIPLAGDAATGAKFLIKGADAIGTVAGAIKASDKAVGMIASGIKIADDVVDTAKTAKKVSDAVQDAELAAKSIDKISDAGKSAAKVAEDLKGSGKAELIQSKIDEILSMERGTRPDPSTYMSKEYIDNHLAKFHNGVTKISANVPSGIVGPPGGTFVMPKSIADSLIKDADGDVAKLEKLLSLEPGTLGSNPVRIDIASPEGLRMTSGNELGANKQWIPGGYTGGGIPEATIDPALPGTYDVTYIK